VPRGALSVNESSILADTRHDSDKSERNTDKSRRPGTPLSSGPISSHLTCLRVSVAPSRRSISLRNLKIACGVHYAERNKTGRVMIRGGQGKGEHLQFTRSHRNCNA